MSAVPEPNPLRGTALILGVVGIAMASAALLLVLFGVEDLRGPTVGVLARVAAILLAVSLVLPTIRKPNTSMLIVVGLGLVLILLRPGLIWAGLIGWWSWVLLGRQRTDDKAS